MDKLKNLWQNIQVLLEFMMEWPKTSIITILTICISAYIFVPKIPNAIGCFWVANVKYSLEYDRYRFNWFVSNDQCQRKRPNGDWLPMDRVIDATSGSEDNEED